MFEQIFIELNTHKVNYAVIDGIAVNLHGYRRNTGDLDIVIALTNEDIQKFIQAVKKLAFVPRLPVALEEFADANKRKEWIDKKNMLVFSVYNPQNPLEHIDVKIEGENEIQEILKSRVWMDAGSFKIPVIGLDCLIKVKERAGRGRDLVDLQALKQIKNIKNDKK